jgi:hypothetical protein
MANLLESSQTQKTVAPDYYNTHLSNIAGKAAQAIDPTTGAQFVGATDLQNKAFANVDTAGHAGDTSVANAGSTLGTAVDSTSPLSAANPYLASATGDLGTETQRLMNPYTANVVNSIADAGQRNIMQNLAPQATAGAVGSGQFGSKRGAEVLGQTIANANKDIQNQQFQALNTGYNSALQAAIAQNQVENQAGSTAANAASSGQQNLTAAGRAQTELGKTEQDMALTGVNANATLGAQQQTIEQNKELFPLTNLTTAAGLLRGYNIPTETKTTAEMSPLSAAGAAAAGAVGLFTPGTGGKTPYDNISDAYNRMKGGNSSPSVTPINQTPPTVPALHPESDAGMDGLPALHPESDAGMDDLPIYGRPAILSTGGPDDDPAMHPGMEWDDTQQAWVPHSAKGGLISAHADGGSAGAWNSSFAPGMSIGGLPSGGLPQYDQSNTYVGYNNTDGNFVPR